jgi:hypothetical protein
LAKWDLSKLPEGRAPLPDEWFREKAQMQERIEELEAKLNWVLVERDKTFNLMLDRAQTAEAKLAKAVEALDGLLAVLPDDEGPEIDYARITIAELKGESDE